jgi:hypothetical protein
VESIGNNGFPVTFRFIRHGIVLPETVVKQACVEILGPDTASPSSLLLLAAAGEHVRKKIAITSRIHGSNTAPPKVTGVLSGSGNVFATWANDPQQSNVTIDYKTPAKSGIDRGEIIVTVSDHETSYKIKVSYLAIIH